VSVLHDVKSLPTHWRGPLAGFALLLATVAAAQPAADERTQAHAEFKRLFDAGDYTAAAEHGRRVVELAERAGTADGEELQVALMNLALAQQRADDYLAAEASFQRVIGLIEASGRMTNPRLARAYAGLGITYHAARRFDLAAAALARAIALNRRAEGLFNVEQLPLLEKQADALTELGRLEEALVVLRYSLRVVARHEGERSLPVARQLESIGRWYTRVRSFEAARATLRRATELAESIAGADSTALVGPLTGFAENARRWLTDPIIRELDVANDPRNSMFHDPVLPAPPSLSPSTIGAEGLKALERAAAIVDADPDASPALVAGVHSQLGDWHSARGLPERARSSYERAWQAAGAAPEGARLRQALFGAPQLIHYVPPEGWDRFARRPPEEIVRQDVEIELTVTADGGTSEPRVVAGGDDERRAGQALRAVGTARYRPRLVDGQPVATTGVRFVQPFYVLSADEATAPPGAAPDEKPPTAMPATPPPQGPG